VVSAPFTVEFLTRLNFNRGGFLRDVEIFRVSALSATHAAGPGEFLERLFSLQLL